MIQTNPKRAFKIELILLMMLHVSLPHDFGFPGGNQVGRALIPFVHVQKLDVLEVAGQEFAAGELKR
jgi:hypothetical protein